MTATAAAAAAATRYPELTVAGAPAAMGEQIGEALGEEIRAFDAIALERVRLSVDVSRERALEVAGRCVEDVRGYAPHMLAELEGMSRACGVSVEALMMLQIRNQLQPDSGRVFVDDTEITALSPSGLAKVRQRIGFLFQNAALFDSITVAENVAFPLRRHSTLTDGEIRARALRFD